MDYKGLRAEQAALGAVVVVDADRGGALRHQVLRDAFDLGHVVARDDDHMALPSRFCGAHQHAAQLAAIRHGIPRFDAKVGKQRDRLLRQPQRLVRARRALVQSHEVQFAQRMQGRHHAVAAIGQDLQRHFVAHAIRLFVGDGVRHRWRVLAERPCEFLLDALLLEAQLRRVVDVLPVAAAAFEEVTARGLDAFQRRLVDVGNARAAELASSARDLRTDAFSRQRARNKHDVAIDVRKRVRAIRQRFDRKAHAVTALHRGGLIGSAHGGAHSSPAIAGFHRAAPRTVALWRACYLRTGPPAPPGPPGPLAPPGPPAPPAPCCCSPLPTM